jgi:hypothetical protein
MRTPLRILRDRFSGEDVNFLPRVMLVNMVVAVATYFITDALFR